LTNKEIHKQTSLFDFFDFCKLDRFIAADKIVYSFKTQQLAC
jgi:hypothetical protein